MAAIRDQRTMSGHARHRTVDEVEEFWKAFAELGGLKLRRSERRSRVYISAGCYVADCPADDCNGAAAVWKENKEACCLSCGMIFRPQWPTAKTIGGSWEEVEEILAERPKELWRNFRASDPDETIDQLKAQNVAMGDALPGGPPAEGPHPLDATIVRG